MPGIENQEEILLLSDVANKRNSICFEKQNSRQYSWQSGSLKEIICFILQLVFIFFSILDIYVMGFIFDYILRI
jgi:hypothetical protein